LPGGEITERVASLEKGLEWLVKLVDSRLGIMEKSLERNSDDTRATKKLLLGILVSVVLAFAGVRIVGCMGL